MTTPEECKGFAETSVARLVRVCGSYGFRSPKRIEVLLCTPDEQTLLTLDEARELAFWNVASGARVRAVPLGEGGAIGSAALSRDGSTLLTGAYDGRIALYDVARGERLWDVFATRIDRSAARGHFSPVPPIKEVAISPDGRHFASSAETEANVVRLWDGKTLVGTLPGEGPLVFSPDGRILLVGDALYDVRTGRAIARMLRADGKPLSPSTAAFSADGTFVCTGHRGGAVQLRHPASGRVVWEGKVPELAPGHATNIYGVFFSANGATIVTTSVSAYQVWNARDGRVLSTGKFAASGVVFAPRSGRLFGFGGNGKTLVKQVDLASGREVGNAGHTAAVNAVAFSPRTPGVVLTGSADGTAKLWDLASGTTLRTFEARSGSKIASVAFVSNGARVVAAGDEGVRAWNADTGAQVAELTALSKKTTGLRALRCMVAQREGAKIVLCNQDGHVRLWDVDTQTDAWDIELDTNAVCFTPDGKGLVAVSTLVERLDASTGARIEGVRNPNIDGQRSQPHVFFGGAERAARVITEKGLTFGPIFERAELVPGSIEANHVLAMSSDERIVVTSLAAEGKSTWDSKNGPRVALWDVAKGELIGMLDLSSSDDHPVCAAIDGSSLVVGTARGMLLQFALKIAPAPVARAASAPPSEVKSHKGGTIQMAAVTVPAAAAPSAPAPAPAPAPAMRTSSNGRVTVPAIAGDGWLMEETVTAGETPVTMLKCKRIAPGEFFFMLAKVYEVAPASALPADELTNRVFRGTYDKMFERVQVAGTRWIEQAGVRWYEAAMELTHSSRGIIAKVERACAVGPKVFVLSAEGGPADVRAHYEVAERWLGESKFAELAQGTAKATASAPPGATLQSAPPVKGPSAPPADARPRSAPPDVVVVTSTPEPAGPKAALVAELEAILVKGNGLYARGKYAEAKELVGTAQVRALRELGESHKLTFIALANCGEIQRAIGDAVGADAMLKHALKLGTAAVDATDPHLIQTMLNLGRARLELEDLAGAERHFVDGLERARRRSPTAPHVAQALCSLGYVHILRNDFGKAEKLLRESLAIVAPPAEEGLRALHNLGRAVGQAGRIEEAEPLLVQALEGRRGMLGPEHPDTIESTASLGTLYFVSQRPERAAPLFQLALELTRRVHGAESLLTAERLVDVALNANALGDSGPALPALTEAVMIRNKRLGPDHPRAKWAAENLRGLRRALGLPEVTP